MNKPNKKYVFLDFLLNMQTKIDINSKKNSPVMVVVLINFLYIEL